ncbi:MAG: hypothetical protein J6A94_10365 [Lachnospiraceae bacterium]|nr:hypothetical protein [Lachnospiraceae bacterium]
MQEKNVNKKHMEKALAVMGMFGVSLILVGTLTACNISKQSEVQNMASQVQVVQEVEIPQDVMNGDRLPTEQELNSVDARVAEVDQKQKEQVLEATELDTKTGITLNSDGTYSFSNEFLGSITNYSYFEGATEEEINKFLQDLAPEIEGMADFEVQSLVEMFSATGSKLHKENETIKQSQGNGNGGSGAGGISGNGGSGASSSNSGSNNGNYSSNDNSNSTNQGGEPTVDNGGLITDPDYELDLDPSIWGDVDTNPIGGGELKDGGHDWNIQSGTSTTGDNENDKLIQNPDGTRTTPDGTFTFDDPSSFGGGELKDGGHDWNIK